MTITSKVVNSTLTFTPPSNGTWKIFSFYERFTNQKSTTGGTNPTSIIGNGSWIVDHFSSDGARVTTDFFDTNVLDSANMQKLAQIGQYGKHDIAYILNRANIIHRLGRQSRDVFSCLVDTRFLDAIQGSQGLRLWRVLTIHLQWWEYLGYHLSALWRAYLSWSWLWWRRGCKQRLQKHPNGAEPEVYRSYGGLDAWPELTILQSACLQPTSRFGRVAPLRVRNLLTHTSGCSDPACWCARDWVSFLPKYWQASLLHWSSSHGPKEHHLFRDRSYHCQYYRIFPDPSKVLRICPRTIGRWSQCIQHARRTL